MNKTKPARVSRENRCPICGKSDWCMIGDAYVLCMRVVSDKPKTLQGGETGWLHARTNLSDFKPEHKEVERPILNVERTLSTWRSQRSTQRLAELSVTLGVTVSSLEDLGVVHAPYHQTWAFPMRTGDNQYCGIRLRNIKGEKWAERGSHQGLFIPQCEPQRQVMIVEGPTDCAAALTLGYYAVGRPSCSGGVDHLRAFVARNKISRVLIVSDLDDPGLRGARSLQELLPVASAILVCPAKDMRTFVNHGGDREMIEAMTRQLIWRTHE
jgi:5S rRNA maturation endonuclease (ribonuclease M5)